MSFGGRASTRRADAPVWAASSSAAGTRSVSTPVEHTTINARPSTSFPTAAAGADALRPRRTHRPGRAASSAAPITPGSAIGKVRSQRSQASRAIGWVALAWAVLPIVRANRTRSAARSRASRRDRSDWATAESSWSKRPTPIARLGTPSVTVMRATSSPATSPRIMPGSAQGSSPTSASRSTSSSASTPGAAGTSGAGAAVTSTTSVPSTTHTRTSGRNSPPIRASWAPMVRASPPSRPKRSSAAGDDPARPGS